MNPNSKSALKFVLPALVFAGMSIFLNPFQYDDGNSGRYLLPVLQDMDPALFEADGGVESLRNFGSGFYLALASVLEAIQIDPQHLSSIMVWLFLVTRFFFALALIFLTWQLVDNDTERCGVASVLLVWFSFPVGVSIAGVAISFPTMNHSTVSEVVMVLSVALLVAQRFGWMTVMNAGDVWVHPLMAVHRMGALAPGMLASRRDRMAAIQLLGLFAFFAASVVAYSFFLGPPSLDSREAEIFVAAKGRMVHNSPFVQPLSAWVVLGSFGVLAWCATRRFTAGFADPRFRLMWWTIVSGAILGLTLSALSHGVQLPLLIRLQPMRMFLLPLFGCVFLIAAGTVRAYCSRDSAWPWLAAVVATSMLHGGMQIIVTAVAAVVVAAQTVGGSTARKWANSRFVFGMFGVACLILAVASDRSAYFVVGALVLMLILVFSATNASRAVPAAGLLLVFLTLASISSWLYFRVEPAESTGRPRFDPEYFAALEWIRDNTDKGARFATEPGIAFFRTRSLRTSVNEAISAVVWVDPRQSLEDKKRSDTVNKIFETGSVPWDRAEIGELSRQLGFEYVLTRQVNFLDVEPEYSSGPFHVYFVR